MNNKYTKRFSEGVNQIDETLDSLSRLSNETIETLHFIIDKEQARRIRKLLEEVMPDYKSE